MAQGLTIYFSVHANPLKNEDGETTYQIRQDTRGALSTKGLMRYMRDNPFLIEESHMRNLYYYFNPNYLPE